MDIDEGSGLSQGIGGMLLSAPPGLVTAVNTPIPMDDMATDSVQAQDDLVLPRAALWLPEAFFHTFLDTAVLQHFEVIQAGQALQEGKVGLLPCAALTGWTPLERSLKGLAFAVDSRDHWLRLGIVPLEG